MTDDARDDRSAPRSRWDERPEPQDDATPAGPGGSAGKQGDDRKPPAPGPDDEKGGQQGGEMADKPPDPFDEIWRARERRGGREARREEAAGARYYYIGGDYHEAPGDRVEGIVVHPVRQEELAAARTGFAPPEFFARACELLAGSGLAVLAYGLSDGAKRRAALNLLGSGRDPVDEIDPRADLGPLPDFAFRPGARYLAMVRSEAGARTLGHFALNRLRDRLAERRCRLVLVVENRLRLPSEQLGDYGVECGNPVEAWFGAETRGLDEYALLLGVAVLGGVTHQAVVDAADGLHRSLARELAKESDERKVVGRLFLLSRDQRAEAVRARVVQRAEETDFGDLQVRVIEFVEHEWYSAVLQYIWEQQELMRPPLLRWIGGLCEHEDEDVRLHAATAVGDLCRHDFGYMWPHVIVPWARSGNPMLRLAAALAADIPARDPALAPHVLGSLRRWAGDDSEHELRWTAAAAFGSSLGRRVPDEALRWLRTMLEKEPDRLAFHISERMGVLFGAGTEIQARVLRALVEWWGDRRRTPKLAVMSLGIFLKLAFGNALSRSHEEAAGWPEVLWLAERDAEMRQSIVTLYRRSLTEPVAQDSALLVIEDWTRQADRDPGLVPALESLLRDLAATHREWRRLCVHLRRWASKTAERPSRSAGRLLATLMVAEPMPDD